MRARSWTGEAPGWGGAHSAPPCSLTEGVAWPTEAMQHPGIGHGAGGGKSVWLEMPRRAAIARLAGAGGQGAHPWRPSCSDF